MNTLHWIPDAIFYHIYPLGLCGAPAYNDPGTPPVNRLAIIKEWIPHLQSLGVNAVYLGPVFESVTHGYDTTHYTLVDRRLGCNSDLAELVDTFHQHGIKVILDAVFNHVGRRFPAFMDVQQNGRQSAYCNWFAGLDFSKSSPEGDAFTYATWAGHFSLVKLNLQNPAVIDHLLQAVRTWFDIFHIDGLRLDAIDQVDLNFLRELRKTTQASYPEAWLMGESVGGDYRTWANPEMVHSITNYECYKGLYSSHNDQNLFEIAYAFNRQSGTQGIYKDLLLYNFVDNHDVNRLASMVKKQEYLTTIYLLLYTMPGIPSIYYGSEWGIPGEKTSYEDKALRPVLDLGQNLANPAQPQLTPWLQQLAFIRHTQQALKTGSYQEVYLQSRQFAFLRSLWNEDILAAINIAGETVQINLPLPIKKPHWVDLLHPDEHFHAEGRYLNLSIPANSGRILKAEN
jgi:cyclomaltodextrinase / maltogenic alpha-amylase / neopullulanase